MVGGGAYFGDTYEAMCREAGVVPSVRMRPGERVLELQADRLKLDDWRRVLRSLSSDRGLHYISIRVNRAYGHNRTVVETASNERAARNCKRTPALYTKFVMGGLAEALASALTHSKAITSLLLCRVPLKQPFLVTLVQGLSKNTSLQHLALQHCPVGDDGVEEIAGILQAKAALTTLEFSDCGISDEGAAHIAALIKVHSHERYGECWKYSLRYSIVDKNDLPGLRRLTLNQNPDIGDKGLAHIIEALYDDMWIRAVDMQRCGLTEEGCREIERLISINKDLSVFDIRGNKVSLDTLKDILLRLEKNTEPGSTPQFSWLEESLTPSMSQMSLASSRPATPSATVKKKPPSPTKSTTSLRTTISDAPWHTGPKQRSRFTVSKRSSVLSFSAKKCRSAEQVRRSILCSRQSTDSERTIYTNVTDSETASIKEEIQDARIDTRSEPHRSGHGDAQSRPPVFRTRSGGFKLLPQLLPSHNDKLISSSQTSRTDSEVSTNSQLKKVESSMDLTKNRAKELFSKFLAAKMAHNKGNCSESNFDTRSVLSLPSTQNQPYLNQQSSILRFDKTIDNENSPGCRLTVSRPPTPHPAHSSSRYFSAHLSQSKSITDIGGSGGASVGVRLENHLKLRPELQRSSSELQHHP